MAAGVWSLPVAPIVGVAGSVVWVAATTGFALETATLDGQTCRTVGVHITVECPVDSTAAGHAALDAAVAEVRRQLDMLGPSRSRVVLVDGPEAQDARG